MSELSNKFTHEDIETLIEAMNDWENIGTQEWQIAKQLKKIPMPPKNHEAYPYIASIKQHFAKRSEEINRTKNIKEEKAVLMKAKLMLVRRELAANQLFNMVENVDPNSPLPQEAPEAVDSENYEDEEYGDFIEELNELSNEDDIEPPKPIAKKKNVANAAKKLEQAEYFIRDLGVWDHYMSFLKSTSDSVSSDNSES